MPLAFTPATEALIADEWRIGSQDVIRASLAGFANDLAIYSEVITDTTTSTINPQNAFAQAINDYLICGRWDWGKFPVIPGNAYSWSIILHMLNAETNVAAAYDESFTALPAQVDSVNTTGSGYTPNGADRPDRDCIRGGERGRLRGCLHDFAAGGLGRKQRLCITVVNGSSPVIE